MMDKKEEKDFRLIAKKDIFVKKALYSTHIKI